ncbi:MAG TPA: glycosyltransferase family 4 protein [Candidatus Saccharimonadales bacterium]
MKILSILSSGYEQGGAETAVVIYDRALKRLGHDSRIMSSDARPDKAHFSDYEFKAIPATGLKSVTYSIFNPSAYRLTKKVLREFQPDVVVLNTMQQVTPSVLFLLRNYPTIQCVHGPEAFTTSLLTWHMGRASFKNQDYDVKQLTLIGRLRYLYLRLVMGSAYKLGFHNVNRFVVFSEYMERLLHRDGFKQPVSTVRLGVDLAEFTTAARQNPPVIGYVGRLESFKGVSDLLDAMPLVLQKQPAASLVIAGDGADAATLRAHANELGIKHAVTFKGHVSQRALQGLYREMSVLVMPSRWPEAFGKVGVEAMSVGTPVIATNVGGVTDWLHDGKNGLLTEPCDPTMLADRILALMQGPKCRETMGMQARKTAEGFTNKAYTVRLIDVIKETVG